MVFSSPYNQRNYPGSKAVAGEGTPSSIHRFVSAAADVNLACGESKSLNLSPKQSSERKIMDNFTSGRLLTETTDICLRSFRGRM